MYEISLQILMFKDISSVCSAIIVKYFSTLEEKFHISMRPSIILYMYVWYA